MAATKLLALDARTGAAVASFGTNGEVEIGVPYNSVPGVFRNVVVVGANTPPRSIGGIGNPLGWNRRYLGAVGRGWELCPNGLG